ncbi:MAG: MurR/RpiR family transcriptional regulator [Chloroflexi bacterium]|nr:MurR/RpiR family transcriptional regulator [Chloroflexota bacterium]
MEESKMVLEKLRQLYPELTKSQRRLADFIATSYREAAFMTASRLARRLGVNEATVIRFAQRLGYSGYPELVQDIRAIVQDELYATSLTTDEAAASDVFFGMLAREVDGLQRSTGHFTADAIHGVLSALRVARRVVVVGQGIAFPLAQLFSASLRLAGVPASCPQPDALELAALLDEVGEGWLVVGISVAPESIEIARALRYAGEQGARTVALTWSPISPAAQVADWAISCPADDLFPLPSVAALTTLIDALVQTVAMENRQAVTERMAQVARVNESIIARRRR